MGFECGFDIIPRLAESDEDSLKLFRQVTSYLRFKTEDWIQKNFSTFEEYWNSWSSNPEYPGIPDKEDINKVLSIKNKFNLGEYDGYAKTLMYWCSIGRHIDDTLVEYAKFIDDDRTYAFIDDNFIKGINDYLANDRLGEMILVSPEKGFKVKEDTESEEDVIETRPIDGIEAYDEHGHYIRIYSQEFEYGDTLYYGDMEYFNINKDLEKFLDMLEIIDRDQYVVYYWRSY